MAGGNEHIHSHASRIARRSQKAGKPLALSAHLINRYKRPHPGKQQAQQKNEGPVDSTHPRKATKALHKAIPFQFVMAIKQSFITEW